MIGRWLESDILGFLRFWQELTGHHGVFGQIEKPLSHLRKVQCGDDASERLASVLRTRGSQDFPLLRLQQRGFGKASL